MLVIPNVRPGYIFYLMKVRKTNKLKLINYSACSYHFPLSQTLFNFAYLISVLSLQNFDFSFHCQVKVNFNFALTQKKA